MRPWLAAASAYIFFMLSTSCQADFRSQLARGLNISDAQWLVINLPPRPECYPGAIFTGNLRTILRTTAQNRRSFAAGSPFDLSVDIKLEAGGDASVGSAVLPFGMAAEASDVVSASLILSRTRVLEITGPAIQDALKQLPSSMRKADPAPAIVIRAYEGVISLVLTRKAGAAASAFARVKQRIVDAGFSARLQAEGSVGFDTPEPTIFAFEIARVTDYTQAIRNNDTIDVERRHTAGAVRSGTASSAGVSDKSPAMTGWETTATVGTGQLIERERNLPEGDLTGLIRIQAEEFERKNPAPGPIVR